MQSIEQIIAQGDEASVKADEQKLQPLVANSNGDEGVFKCPSFGYYRPSGWEVTNEFFVDNSGFGSANEPALTAQQFIEFIKEGYGYAITEEGQFQLRITEFKKL